MPLNDLAPSHRERLRDDAVKLRNLLRGIRGDFALFDVRDQVAGLGVDRDQIDAFDAQDDNALDDHIDQAHAVATALGAEDDTDHSTLFGDSGQDVLVGGMGSDTLIGGPGDDTISVAAAKPPSALWPNVVAAGRALVGQVGAARDRVPSSPVVAKRIGREERERAAERAARDGVSDHNNRHDAERHARWTYRMAKELSPGEAALYGDFHELTGLARWAFPSEANKHLPRNTLGQQLRENLMDLHNNGVGVGQARGGAPDARTPGLTWFGK